MVCHLVVDNIISHYNIQAYARTFAHVILKPIAFNRPSQALTTYCILINHFRVKEIVQTNNGRPNALNLEGLGTETIRDGTMG